MDDPKAHQGICHYMLNAVLQGSRGAVMPVSLECGQLQATLEPCSPRSSRTFLPLIFKVGGAPNIA